MDAIEYHKKNKGKIWVEANKIEGKEDLSLAYTPGVAEVCKAIEQNKDLSFELTWRGKAVAIISDGTRVLGLGDIGPEAAMPVMEGKAALAKAFAGVDAIPICLKEKDKEKIIEIIKALEPSFGLINLEDIQTEKVVEIYNRLYNELNIPLFHDDRHGTGIVVLSAIINTTKLLNIEPKVAIIGAGAAGLGISEMLYYYGIKASVYDSKGMIRKDRELNNYKKEFLKYTQEITIDEANIIITASQRGAIDPNRLKDKEAIFSLENPNPAITYEEAKKIAKIAGTGRSDKPNQINNVLAFPGIFKAVLSNNIKKIKKEHYLAAARAIANTIEPTYDQIIPNPFNKKVVENIVKEITKIE